MSNPHLDLAQLSIQPELSSERHDLLTDNLLNEAAAAILEKRLTLIIVKKARKQVKDLPKENAGLNLPLSSALFELSTRLTPQNSLLKLLEEVIEKYHDKEGGGRPLLKKLYSDVKNNNLIEMANYAQQWKDTCETIFEDNNLLVVNWWKAHIDNLPPFQQTRWEKLFLEEIASELARLGRLEQMAGNA